LPPENENALPPMGAEKNSFFDLHREISVKQVLEINF
jgi:hypothetical protein